MFRHRHVSNWSVVNTSNYAWPINQSENDSYSYHQFPRKCASTEFPPQARYLVGYVRESGSDGRICLGLFFSIFDKNFMIKYVIGRPQ